ncbi:hypothetical protein K7432_014992 [Basidiobolus ranarum]|uniref:SF4 helicase domain-containing protein n=1 Tax=Basidiobolus ranarum TaxID=34480 RepID=A0ABR2WGT5_9FUNG
MPPGNASKKHASSSTAKAATVDRSREIRQYLWKTYNHTKRSNVANEVTVKCPKCPRKPYKFNFTAQLKTDTGNFRCSSCLSRGSWEDFKLMSQTNSEQGKLLAQEGEDIPARQPYIEIQPITEFPDILGWCIDEKGISPETLEYYGVGVGYYPVGKQSVQAQESDLDSNENRKLCLSFPRTAYDQVQVADSGEMEVTYRTVRVKATSWPDSKASFFDPDRNGAPGLFGFHTIHPESEKIILAGREFDAMAAYQATGIPAISLPHGLYQLPLETLPMLDRFQKIYLWFDDDIQGQDIARRFADKLGIDRCLIVNTLNRGELDGPINASQALIMDKNLSDILKKSKPLGHEQILDFSTLRDAVHLEISNPTQVRGVQSKDFPSLNSILKGHRPGELTVITGPTGIGKTTFLSQLTLDFCTSGVSTLWGSFEIPNVRLAKKMLCQFANQDLSETPEHFIDWANQFEQLPMHFLKYHGSTQVHEVVETMRHAVFAYDVQHVVIDNLQFMTSGQGRSFDKWEIQENAVSTFRKFATENNIHVTLVVHPRKDDREFLELNSIFGSGKVTQEADNVVIMQPGVDMIRFLDIKKNRFDGTLGLIPYRFNKTTMKMQQLSESEFESFKQRHAQVSGGGGGGGNRRH